MHLEKKLGSLLWDKIHWIAGTSTGAILALALAKSIIYLLSKQILAYPLEHLQKLYLRLKNDVFVGSRPYNATVLEKFLKQELGEEMMDSLQPQK